MVYGGWMASIVFFLLFFSGGVVKRVYGIHLHATYKQKPNENEAAAIHASDDSFAYQFLLVYIKKHLATTEKKTQKSRVRINR